ncbi:hypothetical protein LTR84_001162 [Exophiala bonariae]|uniref:Uncharacterized protein n=1 Tax=Exophiala bonariae TaxID=1690606 RepID=A0AAV9NSM9_9EURO|nr:hypothetical protein LTR84_001162 [Exophiala bonariae]
MRDTTIRKLALQQKRRATIEAAEQHSLVIIYERLALWLMACPLSLRYELYSHLNIHSHWSKRFKNPPNPEYVYATFAYSIECVREEIDRLGENAKKEAMICAAGFASDKSSSVGRAGDREQSCHRDVTPVVQESATANNTATFGLAAKPLSGVRNHGDNSPYECSVTNTSDGGSQLNAPSVIQHVLIPAEADESLDQEKEQQENPNVVNSNLGSDGSYIEEVFIDLEDFLI